MPPLRRKTTRAPPPLLQGMPTCWLHTIVHGLRLGRLSRYLMDVWYEEHKGTFQRPERRSSGSRAPHDEVCPMMPKAQFGPQLAPGVRKAILAMIFRDMTQLWGPAAGAESRLQKINSRSGQLTASPALRALGFEGPGYHNQFARGADQFNAPTSLSGGRVSVLPYIWRALGFKFIWVECDVINNGDCWRWCCQDGKYETADKNWQWGVLNNQTLLGRTRSSPIPWDTLSAIIVNFQAFQFNNMHPLSLQGYTLDHAFVVFKLWTYMGGVKTPIYHAVCGYIDDDGHAYVQDSNWSQPFAWDWRQPANYAAGSAFIDAISRTYGVQAEFVEFAMVYVNEAKLERTWKHAPQSVVSSSASRSRSRSGNRTSLRTTSHLPSHAQDHIDSTPYASRPSRRRQQTTKPAAPIQSLTELEIAQLWAIHAFLSTHRMPLDAIPLGSPMLHRMSHATVEAKWAHYREVAHALNTIDEYLRTKRLRLHAVPVGDPILQGMTHQDVSNKWWIYRPDQVGSNAGASSA